LLDNGYLIIQLSKATMLAILRVNTFCSDSTSGYYYYYYYLSAAYKTILDAQSEVDRVTVRQIKAIIPV